jgi:hypothetical protein
MQCTMSMCHCLFTHTFTYRRCACHGRRRQPPSETVLPVFIGINFHRPLAGASSGLVNFLYDARMRHRAHTIMVDHVHCV